MKASRKAKPVSHTAFRSNVGFSLSSRGPRAPRGGRAKPLSSRGAAQWRRGDLAEIDEIASPRPALQDGHREDAERSEGDDTEAASGLVRPRGAIPSFSARLLRPVLPCRTGLAMTGTPGGHAPHCREVGACLRPPPHGSFADTERQRRTACASHENRKPAFRFSWKSVIDRFLAALLPWLHRSFAFVGQTLRARPRSGAPNAPPAHSLHTERKTAFEGASSPPKRTASAAPVGRPPASAGSPTAS